MTGNPEENEYVKHFFSRLTAVDSLKPSRPAKGVPHREKRGKVSLTFQRDGQPPLSHSLCELKFEVGQPPFHIHRLLETMA